MNPYIKNLNRIEFLITLACTGRCKHCSEGEHVPDGVHLKGDAAAEVVYRLCKAFSITSLMTFGGEPLLYPETVYTIHAAARDMHIPQRQVITNGFFSRDAETIRRVAENLAQSGVNDLLLSVDAFHQETIPLEPVRLFAEAAKQAGIPVRTHPAWLVDPKDGNPYNRRTLEILETFASLGIFSSKGNIVFPSGNALTYLSAYFDPNKTYVSPYAEDPADVRAICVSPNGDVLGGNLYRTDILDLVNAYTPCTGNGNLQQ